MIAHRTAPRTGPARARVASVAVLVAVVVLAAPAMLAGLGPGAGVLEGALTGSCASAGEVHAGLVVDFGTVDTGSARPANTSDCVADSGGNGVTLLAARFGKAHIRIGANGLICAIDDYPKDGCGDHLPNGRYRYWSYWKAVGADDKEPPAGQSATKWLYAPIGPASRTIKDGSVDGWHFVEGSASPSDGAPGNSGPAGPCGPSTPTTPTTSGGGSGGSGGSGGVGSSGGSGGSGDGSTPTSTGASSPDASFDPAGAAAAGTDPGAAAGSDPATGGTGGEPRWEHGRRVGGRERGRRRRLRLRFRRGPAMGRDRRGGGRRGPGRRRRDPLPGTYGRVSAAP